MASNFTVVYDACVLYPAPLRDLLMHLALTDMYRARWSNMIHDEWTRNVLEHRKDLKPEAIARTRQLMDANVREALVENFEHLIPAIELPDPDDRHVVAAAMRGRRTYYYVQPQGFSCSRIAKVQCLGLASGRLHLRPVRPQRRQSATGCLSTP